jgi:hypothetical protein
MEAPIYSMGKLMENEAKSLNTRSYTIYMEPPPEGSME